MIGTSRQDAGPGQRGYDAGHRARHSMPGRRRVYDRRLLFRSLAAAVALLVTLSVAFVLLSDWDRRISHHPVIWGPAHPIKITLPTRPTSYIGAYVHGVPQSYAPLTEFAAANRVRPNIALYYSGWGETFRSAFATAAARHHAVTQVQIDPGTTKLTSIVAGYFDKYLRAYARAVGDFGAKTGQGVIIGFGHEPNGYWYPWGYRHVQPRLWIAAWRHIVTVFRQQGADDVTWLWTVNVMDRKEHIKSPVAWWPGSNYVTWVGIDGYYYVKADRFAALFGPTIKAIRGKTRAPILISETGVKPAAGKVTKIADEFAGIRAYGLLGLVWFNVRGWRLDTTASAAAFATGATTFGKLAS